MTLGAERLDPPVKDAVSDVLKWVLLAVADAFSVISMSSTPLKRALDLALELPENERAALAHDLIASLDGPADAGAQQAWEAEITKRLDGLETGNARTVDADEALRRIDDRLHRG